MMWKEDGVRLPFVAEMAFFSMGKVLIFQGLSNL